MSRGRKMREKVFEACEQKFGYHIPKLTYNLRNCAKVYILYNSILTTVCQQKFGYHIPKLYRIGAVAWKLNVYIFYSSLNVLLQMRLKLTKSLQVKKCTFIHELQNVLLQNSCHNHFTFNMIEKCKFKITPPQWTAPLCGPRWWSWPRARQEAMANSDLGQCRPARCWALSPCSSVPTVLRILEQCSKQDFFYYY